MNITNDMDEIEKILEQAEKIAKLEGSTRVLENLKKEIENGK